VDGQFVDGGHGEIKKDKLSTDYADYRRLLKIKNYKTFYQHIIFPFSEVSMSNFSITFQLMI